MTATPWSVRHIAESPHRRLHTLISCVFGFQDKFDREFAKNTIRSVGQNPYYFTGLFSTTLVAPAAYHFVIAMMSNHTADNVNGYLNGEMFKTWFGVSGTYPNFE